MAIGQELKEIYNSRNILKSLVINNLVGRYKNSLLGFAWNFVIPGITMFTYYIVFTQIRSNEIPYFWVYLSSSLFAFNFLVGNLTAGCSCIVGNAGMIKKMYFPRELIVFAQIISSAIIMIIGYVVVIAAIIIGGFNISLSLLLLPVALVLVLLFSTGLMLLLSSIAVYIRDTLYIIRSFSMYFFFLTPVYYMRENVSGVLSTITRYNPFTYFIELFQEMIYFGRIPGVESIMLCLIITVISLILGIMVFVKLKTGFAERL